MRAREKGGWGGDMSGERAGEIAWSRDSISRGRGAVGAAGDGGVRSRWSITTADGDGTDFFVILGWGRVVDRGVVRERHCERKTNSQTKVKKRGPRKG